MIKTFKDGVNLKALCAYKFCIPSCLDKICFVVGEIIDYLQHNAGHLDECIVFEIRVVLNEIISNAIRHGNKNDESKYVKLSVGTTGNGYAFFIVEDEGNGFNCEEKQFCCTGIVDSEDINDIKESGRGILIVNSLCDKVKFNNKGNKVVILKKIMNK